MSPADKNLTAQPTAASDGKKPSVGKRFLGRFGISKSTKSLASNNPATRSMENLIAPDGKSTVKRFLGRFGGSQSTKDSPISSTHATHSMVNLAALGASAAHLAANIGVATAPTVPEVAASFQVATTVDTTPATNVDQGSPATPAAAGPTSAMNVKERRNTTIVPNLVASQNNPARNPASLANVNQAAPPGPNASQDQSRLKEGMNVALDGFLTALGIAKEASDWNPIVKAALGGVVAVIDLANTVSSNSQDMKDTLAHIQGLLPILETSAKRLESRKGGFGKDNILTNFATAMQTELTKIQKMQSHGLFRRVLQGPKDATTLLDVYKNIGEALEQFKILLRIPLTGGLVLQVPELMFLRVFYLGYKTQMVNLSTGLLAQQVLERLLLLRPSVSL
ncbi:hypothetical protein DXG01_012920 [Tephrocybe rancida]|nr:hypothetical protein DXG01_012920 [Tephrocybe rancida]